MQILGEKIPFQQGLLSSTRWEGSFGREGNEAKSHEEQRQAARAEKGADNTESLAQIPGRPQGLVLLTLLFCQELEYPPQRHKPMMYCLKFLVVIYCLALTDVLSQQTADGGGGRGF